MTKLIIIPIPASNFSQVFLSDSSLAFPVELSLNGVNLTFNDKPPHHHHHQNNKVKIFPNRLYKELQLNLGR